MSKKLIIGISVALVLVGAVVLTVAILRSKSLTEETPLDGGTSATDGGGAGLGSSTSVPGGTGTGQGGTSVETTPQAGPCGDGVCSGGESWCTQDCGGAEERFLGSITAIDVTSTSFKITWKTPTPSTGEVSYGTTAKYELGTVKSETPSLSHAVQIRGLSPGGGYVVRVRATEEGGLTHEAADLYFELPGNAR